MKKEPLGRIAFREAVRVGGILLKRHEGPHPIDRQLRAEVLERDGRRCQACGRGDQLAVDHIWPRSKGGPTIARNLITLCTPCNRSKGQSAPWAWDGRGGRRLHAARYRAKSMLRVVGVV